MSLGKNCNDKKVKWNNKYLGLEEIAKQEEIYLKKLLEMKNDKMKKE